MSLAKRFLISLARFKEGFSDMGSLGEVPSTAIALVTPQDKKTNDDNKEILDEDIPNIENLGIIGATIVIKLDNHKYYYTPKEKSSEDLYKSYLGVFKYSPIRALQYLKKNSNLVAGSVKGASTIYTKDNPRYAENFKR